MKAVNMLGIFEGADWARNRLMNHPRKPIVPRGKPLETKGAAGTEAAVPEAGKPRVSEAEARAAVARAAPGGEVAGHRLIETEARDCVDGFISKAESGRGITRKDVAEIMRNEVAKRRFMAEAPAEAREVLAREQRAIYDATDEAVLRKLRATEEYADAEIKVVEVSTRGRADAASSSADRDIMYVAKKRVTVIEGGKPVMQEGKPLVKDGRVVYEGASRSPARSPRWCRRKRLRRLTTRPSRSRWGSSPPGQRAGIPTRNGRA